jgi:ABC-type transporter Mla subunit MlaD
MLCVEGNDSRRNTKGIMNTKRKAVAHDIEKLIDAIDGVVEALHANKRVLKKALRELNDGSDIATTLAATHAAETRQGANEVLQVLESTRHQSRLSVFDAGLDEGMTIGELARAWGFSRQLAAKYAREVRGQA